MLDLKVNIPDLVDEYRLLLKAELPHLNILDKLGRGGQGLVLYASDDQERPFAIKILRSITDFAGSGQRRFEREVELMSLLDHPHIVKIASFGIAGGLPYLVMPYIEGCDIDVYCKGRDLAAGECVALLLQVCQALAYAHCCGVIHRDLKPSNIIVSDDGHASLLDFGVARAVDSDTALTSAAHMIGTPEFMSPEQILGDRPADARVDIYGLGLLLYEALSGEPPYDFRGDREAIYRTILTVEPTRLRSLNSAVDRDLASIVHKCLEKNPRDRYRSMDELGDDLGRWQAGAAVAARSDHRWYRWKKAARRHKWAVAGALVVAGMACFSTFMWQRAENLSATYKAGLGIYDLVKRGSEAGDEGHRSDAMALWQEALALDAAAPLRNSAIDRMSYEVLHRLCEYHLIERDTAAARPYCADALAVAERYSDRQDEGWQRRAGFAEILRGRVALVEQDYEAALSAFAHSAEIRRGLLKQEPNNESHQGRLAVALSLSGRAARRLNRLDEALIFYLEAHEIRASLQLLNPKSAKRSIDLVQAESKLGVWHLVQDTSENNALAMEWIDRATARLTEMQADGRCEDQAKGCRILAADLARNRGIVQKHLINKP